MTGFVLVPLWPAGRIMYAAAAALLALGACGSWLSARRLPAVPLAMCALCLALATGAADSPHHLVRERVESLYGRIEVFDTGGKRYLLVDGTAQSVMESRTGLSDSEYELALEWARALRPGARRVLALGLGAGLLPTSLERDGLVVDAVEIDPEVVRLARTWFGYAPKGRVIIGDARVALETGERWDLMILDVFGAESPPAHLFTAEAFSRMRGALVDGGVLAVNLMSSLDGASAAPWHATYKTLAEVFPHVRAFIAARPATGLANLAFFASVGPLDAAASAAPVHARRDTAAMLARELTPTPAELASAPVMTDEYAPLDTLLAPTAHRWRTFIQQGMPEVLLR